MSNEQPQPKDSALPLASEFVKKIKEERTAGLPPRTVYDAYRGIKLDDALDYITELGKLREERFSLDNDTLALGYAKAVSWLLALPHPEIDDPMKGLIVTGETGTGKTLLVTLLRDLSEMLGVQRPFYDGVNSRRTMKPFLWNGETHALWHMADLMDSTDGRYTALDYRVLHIGDLGSEPATFQRYGNKASLADLINQRSDYGYRDAPIVATTNLPWSELQRYGDRAVSRLRGDCIEVRLIGVPDHRMNRTKTSI